MKGDVCGRWRGVTPDFLLAIHDLQLAEHGGTDGIRDLGLIDSALGCQVNSWASAEANVADLAASYAHGLVSSHGFVGGNKRTAWVAARLLLTDSGYRLRFDPFDGIRAIEGIASNRISEADLAKWFRTRLAR